MDSQENDGLDEGKWTARERLKTQEELSELRNEMRVFKYRVAYERAIGADISQDEIKDIFRIPSKAFHNQGLDPKDTGLSRSFKKPGEPLSKIDPELSTEEARAQLGVLRQAYQQMKNELYDAHPEIRYDVESFVAKKCSPSPER